jgi:hypothetical protein
MVQTTTVRAYAVMVLAHAVEANPTAMNIAAVARTRAVANRSTQRVMGTVARTMRTALSEMTTPYCAGLRPSSAICTGSVDMCCMKTRAKANVRPM